MRHYKNNTLNLVGLDETGLYDDTEFIKKIVPGSKLWLLREPENPKDNNAISVHMLEVIGKIGYISKLQARKLAPILDRGSQYECFINKKHGNAKSPQITINLTTYPVKRTFPPGPSPNGKTNRGPVETQDHESPTGKKFKRIQNFDSWAKKHDGIGGIYVIWNNQNKCYVGKTDDFGRRWREHRSELFKNKHVNQELQKDWIEMGADAFRFDVLEEDPDDFNAERRWIKRLNSYFRGYNQTIDGGPIIDYPPPDKDKGVHGVDNDTDQPNYFDPNDILTKPPNETIIKSPINVENDKNPETLTPDEKDTKIGSSSPPPKSIDKPDDHPKTTGEKPEPTQSPKPKPVPAPIPPEEPVKSRYLIWVFVVGLVWLILAITFGNNNDFTQTQGNTVYRIQPGDTLSKIAKKYHVDLDKIIEVNTIIDKDLVEPGMTIVIPENNY